MWFPNGARPAASGYLQASLKDSLKDSLKANLQQVRSCVELRRAAAPPSLFSDASAGRRAAVGSQGLSAAAASSVLQPPRCQRRLFEAAGRSLVRSESATGTSATSADVGVIGIGRGYGGSAVSSRRGGTSLLDTCDNDLGDTFKRVRAIRAEEHWNSEVRASMKNESRRAAAATPEQRTAGAHLPGPSSGRRNSSLLPRSYSSSALPSPTPAPLGAASGSPSAMGSPPSVKRLLAAEARPEAYAAEESAIEQRLRQRAEKAANPKARMAACYEDLISFLEMNGLSGAYALAFSANGVENLDKLLTMSEDELSKVIQACDMDAMDEILLLGALRGSRM